MNPVYVPRNYMLQEAILDAENDDFEKVGYFLYIFLKHSYDLPARFTCIAN